MMLQLQVQPRKKQFEGGDNGFGQDELSTPCLSQSWTGGGGQQLRREGAVAFLGKVDPETRVPPNRYPAPGNSQ